MPTEKVGLFWTETKAKLAEVDINARVDPVEEADVFTMEGPVKTRSLHRVVMDSFDGRSIRAWFTLPAGQPPVRGWPAVMEVPGYAGLMPLPVHLVQYGYATLSLYPRSQGESLKEWSIDHLSKLVHNIADRQGYYYRGAYMDCVRGIDFLCARPEIDVSRIAVWGSSQGGGLALATAALDQRLSAAVAGHPLFCSFPLAVDRTRPPYVELRDYLAEHPEQRELVLDNLSYFDLRGLADAISCPVLMNAAISDEVHPIPTIMPVFESIQTVKSIVVYPDMAHGARSDFTDHGKYWLDRYLR